MSREPATPRLGMPMGRQPHGSGSGSATFLAQANISSSKAQSVARTDVSR